MSVAGYPRGAASPLAREGLAGPRLVADSAPSLGFLAGGVNGTLPGRQRRLPGCSRSGFVLRNLRNGTDLNRSPAAH